MYPKQGTAPGEQYNPGNQAMSPGDRMNQGMYKGDNSNKDKSKFNQPASSDDLINQRNLSSLPRSGDPNQYSLQNQSAASGAKMTQDPSGGNTSNFPPPPSDVLINELNSVLRPTARNENQFKPPNQSATPGTLLSQGKYTSLQGAKPFTKSQVGEGNEYKIGDSVYHEGSTKNAAGDKSDEELMEHTVKLQPYLANIEKGMQPQLSRKVYDYAGKSKNTDPKDSSSKFGVNVKGDAKLSASARSDLNQEPSLGSSSTISKENDPNESTRPHVFRGYGRPNFSSVANEPTNAIAITGQYQIPPPVSGQQQSGDNFAANSNLPKQGQFNDDNAKKYGPGNVSNLYGGNSSKFGEKQVLGRSSPVAPSNVHVKGENLGEFDKSNPNSSVGRRNYEGENIGEFDKSNPHSLVGRRNYEGENLGEFDKSNPNSLVGRRNYEGFNPTDSQSKGSSNVNLGRNSPYKEDSSKSHDLGNTMGSYGVQTTGSSGDPRKDTTKISNFAVTLSPSGFKKPQQLDTNSDQYNNQYEDSSKIMPSPLQKYRPDDSTANWTSGPVQKEPPKNFQPTPINVEEEIYKPEVQALPQAVPVSTTLSPEETCKIFQRIDDHAMQVSAQHQDSFNQLIWQLIYARNITDELEKVRVIFLWLCTKDLHKMNFDDIKIDSPEEILMGLKSGKSTYAQIFLTLCRYAGLHCKLIVGYAKGADYVPGMQFQGRHGEHSWNAVLIGGVWRLMDCHWAARRLIGKERKPENVRYELDMFYFLANPSQLIYTHFPHEQDWQLLHHPINIEEFESLAPVKSMFFKYNLDLVTHKNAIINANSPEFELRIAFPKGVEERLLFTFTLTFNDGSDDYKGLSLLRYGRQEIDHYGSHSSFWIRAPIPGSYKLLLYAKLISVDEDVSESSSQNMFGAICEYKVEFNFPARQALSPFPPCQTSTYGPSEVYKKYAIESCLVRSSIFTENGTAEIKFLIHKPDTRVMAKLINSSGKNSDQITEQCVLQRLVGSEEAVINVFLPEPGEYGLEIYANDSKKDGNSFYTVWQYFMVTSSASIVKGLPSLPPGYMGPYEPKFSNFGLSTYSHKDPFIVAKTGELCIQLKTTRERPVRIMTQLIHCSNNVSEMCSNQVLQQARDSIVYFLIRFPHQGFFKLQVFALPYSEMSESLPGVFNYLIEGNYSSSQRVLEFPQQFAQWKEGCYLYEPTDGVLGVNVRPNSLTFRMDVPRANGIAVVVNNEWTKLEKDSSGTWTGDVVMKNFWGKSDIDQLSICANYGMSVDDSFTTILKYSIQ